MIFKDIFQNGNKNAQKWSLIPHKLPDQQDLNKLGRGPPQVPAIKIWTHLAQRFQRKRFLKKFSKVVIKIHKSGH